ncbi:alpha/beta fold hydrolase [Effusibacillus dendaii]|uniref:Alpha/beta hydrolase n=1 Tax=Effusibacillus dendaii TaxID=2743772 RepID=A0A7I8D5S8_9BACL|nr:alpha/beta hydrolase [Effusibacillus dendaii]BCJ85445.1 alpha/beta hydrolase [Effusibacillus dendaii]
MTFCQVNNEKIYFERHGATDGKTLLFVHGAGGSAETWHRLITYLPDFDCVLLDLPAHHRSEGNTCTSIIEYSGLVNQFVQEVTQTANPSLTYVGHSMGGAIGIELACQSIPPAWLTNLVLVTTGARLKVNDQFLTQLAAGQYDPSFAKIGFARNSPQDLIEQVIAQRAFVPTEITYHDFSACNQFDRRNDLQKIQIPVLIAAGEEDRLTPPHYSVFMHEQIPQSTFVQIADAGHYLPLEKPKELADAIRKFIP